jgi:glucosamine--fructose-6-phosphate aminotransferase (isomerizing)
VQLENTHLYQEIHEQPEVLNRLLAHEIEPAQRLAEEIRQRGIETVVIAARGTSDNAGRYAQYLLGAANRLVVALATPSLYSIYHQPPRLGNALVLGISQSGKSPDIVAVLQEARQQGALTATITNSPDSDLAQEAAHIIYLHAGGEQAIAASKTYTSELLAIALLSACLSQDESRLEEVRKMPQVAAATLTMEDQVIQAVQRYRYMRECVVIGRGYNYATAFELALKMKELTYTFVEAYSSADFLHGPLAVIEHGFPAITIAPSGVMLPELQRFMLTLKERAAEIIAISDDPETLDIAHIPLRLPVTTPEWLSPIPSILPGQLFVLHLAHIRNYDPDRPRGLHKVTETY